MRHNDVNHVFIEELKSFIPKDKDIVTFLEDTLNIGRQSVYRRLRGEIPFAFDEIATVSMRLGISVDEIIGKSQQRGTFIELYLEKDLSKIYSSFADDSLELVRRMGKEDNSSLITITNRLPHAFTLDFDCISRFKYTRPCINNNS